MIPQGAISARLSAPRSQYSAGMTAPTSPETALCSTQISPTTVALRDSAPVAQALNSENVRSGLKEILLTHAKLLEALRNRPAA